MIFTEFLPVFNSTDPILPRSDFKAVPVKCFGFLDFMKEFIIWKKIVSLEAAIKLMKESLNLTLLRKKNSNQAKNVFRQLQFFFEIVSEMRTLKNWVFLGQPKRFKRRSSSSMLAIDIGWNEEISWWKPTWSSQLK